MDAIKVLDMTEEEQWRFLEEKFGKGSFHSFETLAFRLRDEVSSKGWDFRKLLNKVRIDSNAGYEGSDEGAFWICNIAQPIHWIVAALIALEAKDA